ncbi:uncharacterized protein LOC114522131 [Dendronephthya gigantea]|uniref:uncharacterized protein LOC114522131 n=1 Tax=Dendronephthya gigantea TaxID=151771 RepID=UPI00106A021F|nr:uncharacterized protein LOC114522131 [Dendronephthya gigantea]
MYVAFVWKGLSENVTCVLSALVGVLSMLFLELSLMTIVILSSHTFITLAYPYRLQNVITKSRLTKVILLSWLLILLKNLSIFLDFKFSAGASFWIICSTIVIVVFTWCWTYKLVSRHRKAIETTQASSNTQNLPRKKILRSTITAFAIVASLIVCYSLAASFTIFRSYLNHSKLDYDTYKILWSVASTLMYSNSLVNPCLVFWRNSGFREATVNILN